MTVYEFHASHEQISPRQLLSAVQLAEQVGFTAAMCSDHLEPWSTRQGHAHDQWRSNIFPSPASTDLRVSTYDTVSE